MTEDHEEHDSPEDPKAEKKDRSPEGLPQEFGDLLKKLGGEIYAVPLGLGGHPRREPAPDPEEMKRKRAQKLRFDRTPSEVKAYLDRFVIGQEEAKKALAVAVCDHYNHARRLQEETAGERIDYVKQNVILLGPTGVGKTYLIRTVAQLLGVPFVKADITKFSETGYIGSDVDDLVRELVRVADGDIELAEYGIVFLDEIDKIASVANVIGRDVSGRGVQTGLLKLLEETEVPARSPQDISAQLQDLMQLRQGRASKRSINTKHILFVVSGAFSGLEEIIERRLSERNVGFGAATAAPDGDSRGARALSLLSQVATRDFIDYGFEPEFIGRLPIRVSLDELTEDDLFRILTTSEGSILRQYRANFQGYGIEVAFDVEALRLVASKALAEKTGARGLMTVLEGALREYKFHLPGTSITRFAVTHALIEDPHGVLAALRERPERAHEEFAALAVREFEEAFAREHGVRLVLDASAVAMAATVADGLALTIPEYLERTFSKHAEFITTLARKIGRHELPVTPQILHSPGEGLELWLGERTREGR